VRKRRAIIYDDHELILKILGDYFVMRGYEVAAFERPVVCPGYDKNMVSCEKSLACADIVLSDFRMPEMNGLDLFKAQAQRGCKIPIQNKAIMSGYTDDKLRQTVQEAGYMFFAKPFSFGLVAEWLSEREPHMDLSQPLEMIRKEPRDLNKKEIIYAILPGSLKLRGVATNMSPSGLCMRTDAPVAVEQSVTILFGQSGNSRPASVRWMRENERGNYLSGVSFV
jgi:DNA-binding NtrC family response regulator